MELVNIDLVRLIVLSAGIFFLLVLLGYYLFTFSRLAFYQPRSLSVSSYEPASIVIAARNEARNLETNLPKILDQDYPNFQVVVVNDCSWDDSEQVLDNLERKHPNLKVVTIQEMEKYSHGKKFAVTLGIKAAEHDLLVFTDADCVPSGKNWLRKIAGRFNPGTKIVLGYGAYDKKAGLLNMLIRFDTFHTAIQYLSFALSKNPYMGVGRNLAYRKSLFFGNKGFANHQHLLSGDDDLFVNETGDSTNTSVEIDPESFTVSSPKTSFGGWIAQKTRHLSTSRSYKSKHQFALGFYWVAQLLFFASLTLMIILAIDWRIVLGLYSIRMIPQLFIFGKGMQQLQETDLIWAIPILDLILILIYPTFALQGIFLKQKKWK